MAVYVRPEGLAAAVSQERVSIWGGLAQLKGPADAVCQERVAFGGGLCPEVASVWRTSEIWARAREGVSMMENMPKKKPR
ncbi:hypothetical protein ACIGO7_35960, partial [Streptomyces virginiae]|uniref:hypothetical protein n=1 Tax=Streptomyces virginiae TaxID=1961 RepID=UPI0037D3E596